VKNYSSILIIYNPSAMKGKINEHIPKIKQRLLLRFSQVDAMYSSDINGAENLAFKFASKYDVVVSCGGDGTLHEIVNGVMKSGANPVIGVLPCGTCNDVAMSLGIPKKLDKAIDCLLRMNTTNYDIMYDGKEYITYSVATGYLVKSTYSATEKSKQKFGRFAYFMSALKCLFKLDSIPVTVTCDGTRYHNKIAYLMFLNGENAGGFKLNEGADVGNGKVKFVMIKRTNAFLNFLTFIKMFMFGVKSIRKHKSVVIKDVQNFEIENHANASFILDGEKIKFLKKSVQVLEGLTIIKK